LKFEVSLHPFHMHSSLPDPMLSSCILFVADHQVGAREKTGEEKKSST
jgi:hypothetical protein